MVTPALSITIRDCEVQTFRSGGKGGQNQNKRDTGVRVIHRPSGAVGESREHRTQLENKRAAFSRMANHPRLAFWIAERLYGQSLGAFPVRDMATRPGDFKIETRTGNGWEELA